MKKSSKKILCFVLAVCMLGNSWMLPANAEELSTIETTGNDMTETEETQEGENTSESEENPGSDPSQEEPDENKKDQEESEEPKEPEEQEETFEDVYGRLKPTLKTRAVNKKIRITFTGLKGSSYYVLQRSARKVGGYRTIARIQGNEGKTYLDSGVSFGKTYYYRVRGVAGDGKIVKSRWSEVKKQRATLTSPVIYAADRMNENTMCIYWEPDKTADGYVIYSSTAKNGTYKKIGTVSNPYEYRFVKKNLKQNTKYYYKVRSYGTLNGKRVYSGLSECFAGQLWKESVLYELFPNGVPKSQRSMYRYMTTIRVPIVNGAGQRSTMSITVHKKLAGKVKNAFRDMANSGIAVDRSCTAGFNYRYMTSGTLLSHHSYGVAVDLNWTYNPYVSYERLLQGYNRKSSVYTIRAKCVAIWKKYGFEWGGNWKTYKDYMHFSYTGH